MPVRSLNSRVLKWPNKETVERALETWALEAVKERPDVVRIGYFGSYARGDWGVGSDVDIIILLDKTEEPFINRAMHWNTLSLPVPADVLVYTMDEWGKMNSPDNPGRRQFADVVWVFER